jgi:uncharacterized protein with FMN-binding domain
MKTGPWLVAAGAVAGFLGVLGFHKSPAATALNPAPSQPSSKASAAATGSGQAAAGQPAEPAGTASATGTMEQYGYGELAARVTISGGHITAVSVPAIRTAEQYSQQLAAQVIPMLNKEVLAAQSAHIQAVSGASYTSQAYAASVQAALDQVHFK